MAVTSRILGVKNVVGVGNGTDALLIGLLSLKLERKEVIVPSFLLRHEAIVQAGLVPVFVDVNEKDAIMLKKLKKK